MLRNYLTVTSINPPERATTVANSCDKELYTFCIMAFSMVWKGKSGQYRNAALEGIEQITKKLATYFPPRENKVNELSNKPVIIKNSRISSNFNKLRCQLNNFEVT